MKMFKNSKGELLRLSAIEMICTVDPKRTVAMMTAGESPTIHVVCTVGGEFPLYPGDFDRLWQVLEAFPG